jgi:hypothetical protein
MDEQFKQQLRTLAEDVITFKFTDDMTLGQVREHLYNLMRKYGIKEGEWNEDKTCRTTSNFEWILVKDIFLRRLDDHIDLDIILFKDTPEDLLG